MIQSRRISKHKEYLHNAGRKSPKQCNNFQDRNVDKNQPKETDDNFLWPLGTCVIVGDSMVNGTDEKRLSKKHGNVKVFHFQEQELKISIST